MPKKVLVFGDDTRSFLATVRSLGRKGIEVHAVPSNLRSSALRSRYIAAIHTLPHWMDEGIEWRDALLRLVKAQRFDLLLPCDETAILPLQRWRETFAPLALLAMPDDDAIEILFDKHRTRELAQRLGIPVAEGRLLSEGDDAGSLRRQFGRAVLIKPRRSYSLDRLDRRAQVIRLGESAGLDRSVLRCPGAFVVEAFRPGIGGGVSVLANAGRIVAAFQHRRVRENASGAYYRVSVRLAPHLVEACAAVCRALRFTGIAMFEFRVDAASGGWILLEVNARPWGSLPLPVALGMDFPFWWCRLLMEGKEPAPTEYRVGVYGRNLLSDLMMVMGQAKRARPAHGASLILSWAAEFRRVLLGREVEDTFALDDLAPARARVGEALRMANGILSQRLPLRARQERRRARRQIRAAMQEPGERRVLFVCMGNVCRSPFAAALLAARLLGRSDRVVIGSYGLIPRPGRPTPDFGLQAAAAFGADLSEHRSVVLTGAAVQDAAAILVFDREIETALLNRFPGVRAPVIRLGCFAPSGADDIADPVDGDLGVFEATYRQIAAAVDGLADLIARR